MNWEEFEVEVRSLVVRALQELQGEHSGEQFYAFALYTDSSAMTIALAGNSLEALELKLQEEDEEDREVSRQYYKWAASEWQYEAWRGELFRNACKALREADGRADILTFRKELYSVMTNILNTLRQGDFFQAFIVQEPTLFVTVTDDDAAESVENETAKILNSPPMYKNFINRFDG